MALSQTPEPFVWGSGGAQLTPEEIARRREIADALMAQGSDYSPVQHWAQGVARLGKAVRGGLERRDTNEAERTARAAAQEKWQPIVDALTGAPAAASPPSAGAAPATAAPASTPPAQAAPTPPTGPSPGVRRVADAMTQVASLDPGSGAPAPAVQSPNQPAAGTIPGLAEARSRYAQELQDPAVAARLAAFTHAEVGSQGPQAQQAFMESMLNRAAARNQTLAETMSGSYFPAITHQRVAQFSTDPQITGRYGDMVKTVLGGSNVGQYATGNASGSVGFNSGPQVAAYGGERFGIEGPDQAWASRLQGGAQPAAAPVQVASADPTFMPPSGAPIVPVPGADPLPARPTPGMQQVAQAMAAQPAPQPSPGAANLMRSVPLPVLMEAVGNPWLPPGQRAVAQALLQQQLAAQKQAAEPFTLGQGQVRYDGTGNVVARGPDKRPEGAGEYGLNPVWGVDAQGNPAIIQLGKDGSPIQPKLPAGVSIAKDPIKIDAGTHYVFLDPQTRQPITTVQKNVAGAAAAQEVGKAAGQAQAQLPGAEGMAAQIGQHIDALANDPKLPDMLGPLASRMPNLTADAARVQAKMDQLRGGVFLQGYGMLKGGGAITEVEGLKAEQAMARLSAAQSVDDYKAALGEFKDALITGLAKLRAQGAMVPGVGQGFGAPGGAPPAAAPSLQPNNAPGGGPSNPSMGAPQGASGVGDPLAQARDAISRGAPRDAVIQRLRQNGIDPAGL
ncbi:hypothetical protein [Xanthobacter autotrophicus]|uniref:hypothetical protein n=1 Tax=Xanthobacter autotrophicus TaxID=280 RepID=UPI0024A68C71|nr:hypothetical protein [Xanthobacter autotrophicus]MDI4655523.1 hypothetical protein [Xanthobacter autotrophicus]